MKKNFTLLCLGILFSTQLFAQNLFTAIQDNDIPAIKYLLQKGAAVDAKDTKGNTPLVSAVKAGNDRAVLLLLQKNPNVDTKDAEGNTPLILAAGVKNLRITDLLLAHYPLLNEKNKAGVTALIAAVQANNPECAVTLLKHGADATIKDPTHKRAADYAKELDNTTLISVFEKADPGNADKAGK